MQPLVRHHDWSTSKQRRWLFMGAFVILALALFVFRFHRQHPTKDAIRADTSEDIHSPRPSERVRWARGSWPSNDMKAETATAIRGVVLNAEGIAVVGAAVVAKDYQVAGNLPMTVSSTQTDEQGRFMLTLPYGMYYIHAAKDDHGPAYARARTGDDLSLIMYKSGVIEGHVRDEKGAPITHFTIDVISPLSEGKPALAPLWSGVFDSPDGSFRVAQLPPYRVMLRASADGYAPSFTDRIRTAVGETRSMNLVLSTGCEVNGQVTDRSGMALPDVFLDADARTTAGILTETSAATSSQAKTDVNGRFHLTAVPKGSIVIRAYDGSNAVTTVRMEIDDCVKIDPVHIEMSPGGAIAGVVRSTEGIPVQGAALIASHRSIGFVHAITDADGRFRFDQMPPNLVNLEVQHEGLRAQVRVNVPDSGIIEKDITLPRHEAGVLSGRVIAGRKPVAGVRVEALSYSNKQKTTLHAISTEDGSYRIQGMPAGRYLLKVASTGTTGHATIKPGDDATVDLDIAEVRQESDSARSPVVDSLE